MILDTAPHVNKDALIDVGQAIVARHEEKDGGLVDGTVACGILTEASTQAFEDANKPLGESKGLVDGEQLATRRGLRG